MKYYTHKKYGGIYRLYKKSLYKVLRLYDENDEFYYGTFRYAFSNDYKKMSKWEYRRSRDKKYIQDIGGKYENSTR